MSNLTFQRGEILTASKLNQLVQAVTSGAPPAAVGNGNVSPSQPHQVRQREFSSYVPFRRPIYIDQTSPHWPLANGTPGWYWRESASSGLTPFPFDLAAGDTVFLKTELSPFGVVVNQAPQTARAQDESWDPYQNKNGVIYEQLGKVGADPYKTGTKANTLQFFEAPATPVVPVLVASAPSTLADGAWVPSFMPPGTYLARASLMAERCYNTQLLNTLQNDGGLIFKACSCSALGVPSHSVEIIPRLAILPAPSTALPPGTPSIAEQLIPGEWHQMSAVDIAGQRLSLNMLWARPWQAYINLSVTDDGDGYTGPTLHQTWQKAWGIPALDPPPSPYQVFSCAWRVVSRSGPFAFEYRTPTMPDSSFLSLAEDVIVQAEGSYAPGTNSTGDAILQKVIFQGYLRRQLAPATCSWYVWYEDCWTTLPWT